MSLLLSTPLSQDANKGLLHKFLDAAVVRDNELLQVSGDFVAFVGGPSNLTLRISMNEPAPLTAGTTEAIPMRRGSRAFGRFSRLYVSNAAGSGTIELIIGGDLSFQYDPEPSLASSNATPPTVAFNTEVLALTASWTELFDFSAALGAQGVIFIFNDGPNPIRISTNSSAAADRGTEVAAGGLLTIDNPGGQQWYARTVTANQVTNAATTVEGFWTGA